MAKARTVRGRPVRTAKPARAARIRRGLAGKPIVGIDLGGTNINVGVCRPADNGDLRVLANSRVNKKTQAIFGVATVIDRIADAALESVEAAGLSMKEIGGIGIGAPGALDPTIGLVLKAPNLGFVNIGLAARLTKKLGRPVYLENDVNAAAYGEWKQGAARGVRDMMAVWIGTGVGGGLIMDGKLYGGGMLTAGEIGHMTLIPGAPLGRRSVEHNCSRTAVAERLMFLVGAGYQSMLKKSIEDERKKLRDKGDFDPSKLIRSRHIAEAFNKGDELTHRVVEESAKLLGISIAGVVTLLSMPCVVLGGGFTEALGEPWVRMVRAAVREYVFPADLKKVEVLGTRLREDAGVVGAAALARENL